MATTVYIPNIALVLTDTRGRSYRVPAGEPVELTDEQARQVSAFVTKGIIHDEDLAASGEVVVEDEKKAAPKAKGK